mmetsp:Transcript_18959/g.21824  ORF Transcript_18959/g.21824 Transcript_18959/m.21824 type:complete len:86 (-) Transcript_18959:1372-1629(-)
MRVSTTNAKDVISGGDTVVGISVLVNGEGVGSKFSSWLTTVTVGASLFGTKSSVIFVETMSDKADSFNIIVGDVVKGKNGRLVEG